MTEPTSEAILARFVVESNKFGNDGYVAWQLFDPVRTNGVLEVSALNATDLPFDCVKTKGIETARQRGKPRFYGWGEFTESTATGIGLKARYDEKPDRHVGIIGWPEMEEDRRLKQKEIAKLAEPIKLCTPETVTQ